MRYDDYKKYMKMVYENRLDEAIDFRREIMPKYIYKFYSLTSKTGKGKTDKRTLDTLKMNRIWCSKLECFNDPYEGRGYYFEFNRDIETNLAKCLRVASFTENAASNISMWAYYANNHKGFCVKYEVVNNKYLYDVNYIEDREPQTSLWEEALKKTHSKQSSEKEQLLIFEKYLTKHISWSNEKEYRIIYSTEKEDLYGRSIGCEELGLKPRTIYTGINCYAGLKKNLNSIARRLGCGDVCECQISDTKFILLDEKKS